MSFFLFLWCKEAGCYIWELLQTVVQLFHYWVLANHTKPRGLSRRSNMAFVSWVCDNTTAMYINSILSIEATFVNITFKSSKQENLNDTISVRLSHTRENRSNSRLISSHGISLPGPIWNAFHTLSPSCWYEKSCIALNCKIFVISKSFLASFTKHTAAVYPRTGLSFSTVCISLAVRTSWPSLQNLLMVPFKGHSILSHTSFPDRGSEKSKWHTYKLSNVTGGNNKLAVVVTAAFIWFQVSPLYLWIWGANGG